MITGLHEKYKNAKALGSNLIDDSVAWRVIQECLATADPLLAFAAWYSTWLNGNISFTQMYSVEETELGMGMTLFAMKPFRVQMFMFRPGAVIKDHRHPDVESYEVYVAGDMELTKDGVPQTVREFVAPEPNGVCASTGGMIRIPAGSIHGGWINVINPTTRQTPFWAENAKDLQFNPGPFPGGCFLSIQLWLRNWEDESVAHNWSGVDGSKHG